MDNVIYIVMQGAYAYDQVDPVIWPFLTEAAARQKATELMTQGVRYVNCDPYDSTWVSLHRVPEGGTADDGNALDI